MDYNNKSILEKIPGDWVTAGGFPAVKWQCEITGIAEVFLDD